MRPPKPWEKYLALLRVEQVNGLEPETSKDARPVRLAAAALSRHAPSARDDDGDLSMRVVDIMAPIGKGQRGLIVAPPRAGKTILLHKIANAIVGESSGGARSSCC